jgi:hypothetical protein
VSASGGARAANIEGDWEMLAALAKGHAPHGTEQTVQRDGGGLRCMRMMRPSVTRTQCGLLLSNYY